jgi:hypothetical protein
LPRGAVLRGHEESVGECGPSTDHRHCASGQPRLRHSAWAAEHASSSGFGAPDALLTRRCGRIARTADVRALAVRGPQSRPEARRHRKAAGSSPTRSRTSRARTKNSTTWVAGFQFDGSSTARQLEPSSLPGRVRPLDGWHRRVRRVLRVSVTSKTMLVWSALSGARLRDLRLSSVLRCKNRHWQSRRRGRRAVARDASAS